MKRLYVIGWDRRVYTDRHHGTRVFKSHVSLLKYHTMPVEWNLIDHVLHYNSTSLLRHRSMKAKHLKEIADVNLKDKNFRAAWEG